MGANQDQAHGSAMLNAMGAEQRRKVIAAARKGERASTWNTYFSRVRCQFVVTGAGPYVYTLAQGTELKAFSYQIGQDMGGVGMPGTIATKADTNLIQAGQTVSGEQLLVFGLSLYVEPTSDAALAKFLFPTLSVTLGLNGQSTIFPLGNPGFIPGGGGLSGIGDSYVQVPSFAEGYTSRSGAIVNGVPGVQNFLPFPQPFVWNPAGQNDSNLSLVLRAERPATFTTATADRVAAAGIAAWTHPAGTAVGTYVEFLVRLWSRQISPRSENS